MGQVFRARDLLTGKLVALKLLIGDGNTERFLREARLLAELDHPGIVRHVAHGTTPDGQSYIAMDWLDGETLSARLRRTRLTDEDSVEVVSRLADALSAAHGRGIVHRDIKPANVILLDSRIDRVKLLDFGIAHMTEASAVMTRTGAVLGTVGYMAPEQAKGLRTLDARADVFALGAVLFHCLTGRPPFAGGGAVAVLAKLVLDDAPRLRSLRPELPRQLDELLAALLAREPVGRPPNAGAVVSALGAITLEPGAPKTLAPSAEEALTGTEQKLVAVLLASGVASDDASEWGSSAFESVGSGTPSETSDVPTRADGRASGRIVREARKLISTFGGRLEPLRSGSMAVMLTAATGTRAGSATDLGMRAARCALSLRTLLPTAPMALATGRGVVAGSFPVGEVIDRAAELLPSAPTSGAGIALCDVTAGLLDGRFEVTGGCVLLGERVADTSRKLLGRPTTTVGRERELRFLEGLLDESIAEPIARAALVVGPAGIGKSRIRYDIARRAARRDEPPRVWTARGDPMSAGSPFGLVSQVLRRELGVLDGEPKTESRARLEAWVAQRFPATDRLRLTGFLGELARVAALSEDDEQLAEARRDPVLMGDQLRRAFEDVIVAECGRGPLLIVIEDLHWGDLPSVNLLDAALRVAKALPLMVLALARPEVRDAFPGLWSQRELTEISIGGLTRKASEKLVREVLGPEVGADTLARIVERADGNAFYLEELIRAVAGGELEKLPETVLAMVQSRLESLPDGARRVLRAASVFGGVFWDAGVACLLGSEQEPEEVKEWLVMLAEREMVTARPSSRFPGVSEHVFRHAMIREAAHAMLTPEDAERGHRLAGGWLEENGEPDALMLAQHFDRGGQPARALTWCRTAAEEAFAGNDLAAAARAAARSLELATALPSDQRVLGELTLLEGEVVYWLGRHADAQVHGERALSLLEDGSEAWFAAASMLTVSSHRSGDVDTERRMARRFLDEGWCDRAGVGALMSSCRIATAMVQIGDYELADAIIDRIGSWAPTLKHFPSAQARWQASLAARALYKGFTWEYRQLSERAAEACEAAGDLRTTAIHRHNASHACIELGMYERAVEGLRETLRLGTRIGVRNVTASAKNNLGAALTHLGNFQEARALLEDAIHELRAQGDKRMEGGAHNHLAELLLAEGDAVGAATEAERAVLVLAHVPPTRIQAMGTLARAQLACGQREQSLATARRANSDLDAAGSIADGEALVRLSLAEALLQSGDEVGAREAAARACLRLDERARPIDTEEGRRAFFERVVAHRRLRLLAQSAG